MLNLLINKILDFLFESVFKTAFSYINQITINIYNDGELKNKAKFKKTVKKLANDSKNLERLHISLDKGYILLAKNSDKEILKKNCLAREKKIWNIFYLVFSSAAKETRFYQRIGNDDELPSILKKAIKLFFTSEVEITNDSELIDFNNLIKLQNNKTLYCTVPVSKKLLKNENLIPWRITVNELKEKDKNWYADEFLPRLLSDTVLKLTTEEITDEKFDFLNFYLSDNWILAGAH